MQINLIGGPFEEYEIFIFNRNYPKLYFTQYTIISYISTHFNMANQIWNYMYNFPKIAFGNNQQPMDISYTFLFCNKSTKLDGQ